MEFKGKVMEGNYRRSFQLNREAINEDSRTVELSFSSEAPYERWFGTEILGHEKGEIDLKRFKSGGHPLLLQHDPNQQIGVIEKCWTDDEDKKGRALVRFAGATNSLAEMVWNDVKDGIRSLVSVGYQVKEWKKLFKEKTDPEEEQEVMGYRAIRWEPLEISLVSTPADTSVGIGRQADGKEPDPPKPPEPEPTQEPMPVSEKQVTIMTRGKSMDEKTEVPASEKEQLALAERQARQKAEQDARSRIEREEMIARQENQRVTEIYALTNQFKQFKLREQALAEKWSVDQVRQAILAGMDPETVGRFEPEPTNGDGTRSIGDIFIRSPQFKQLGPRMSQHNQEKIVVDIPRTDFGAPMQRVAALSAGGAGGQLTSYLTMSQALPGVPGLLDQQQIRIAQMFPTGATTARRISWVKEDAFGNAGLNAATAVREEALKPYWDPNLSETYVDVMKVAAYCKVTEEMLADSDGIRSYLDNRLAYMVQAKEDYLLLYGLAASYEPTGVLQTSGIQTVAAGGYPTVMDAIGQAVGKVRSLGFAEPDGIIVNSNDWTDLILSKDSNGQYYAGGPFMNQYGAGQFSNVFRMFGIPVVVTSFITEGTALVGAFRMSSQLFRREGVRVEATNTHDTDFIYNLITIRAEARMCLAVYKPLGFCSVTGIA